MSAETPPATGGPTEAAGAREVASLSDALREKLIRIRGMDRGLTTLTLASLAVVLLSVLLLLLSRYAPLGSVTYASERFPLPLVVAAAVFLALSWAYLLAGALHAHAGVRLLVLAVYTLSRWSSLPTPPATIAADLRYVLWEGNWSYLPVRDWGSDVAFLLPILVLWITAAGLWLADRSHDRRLPRLHHRRRLRLPTFLLCLIVTGTGYAATLAAAGSAGVFASSLDRDLGALEDNLLIPILFLAGTDFAEWSEAVAARATAAGESISERLLPERHRPRVLAAAVTIAGAVLVAAGIRSGAIGGAVLPTVMLLASAAALGAALARRGSHPVVPFWSLAVAAIAGFWIRYVAAVLDTNSVVPIHELAPATIDAYRGVAAVLGWTPLLITAGLLLARGGRAATGGLFLAMCGLFYLASYSNDLATGLTPILTGAHAPVLPGWIGAVTMNATRAALVLGVAALVLLALMPRRLSARLRTGLLWLLRGALLLSAVSAILYLGPSLVDGSYLSVLAPASLDRLAMAVTARTPPGWADPVSIGGVAAAVGAGALLYASALAVLGRLREHRTPVRLVLVLLLGLAGLWALDDILFEGAIRGSARFTVVQALVLLVALLWDVAMSGEYMTNVRGRHLPRHSRVLLYFGYTMLVATAVMWSVSIRVLPGGLAYQFDSDQWPQLGIWLMGAPLLLTMFWLGIGAWRRGADGPGREGEASGEADAAQDEVEDLPRYASASGEEDEDAE
ncbi:MAG TPA: hypothetical protein VIA06_25505 [Candidatus Dormibacteraeota bacterium]|jgi:hypothetical protein|nr:hypothetical protein [Candidatus Dormibacteraeota bacterium]